MKNVTLFILVVLFTQLSFSQTMTFHKKNSTTVNFQLSQVDYITFSIGQDTIPIQGLVAYYPFNGNTNDESGNGNNGTLYGPTLTTDRFGNPNKAYSFNGTSDYIRVSDSQSLDIGDSLTITAWGYIPAISSGRIVRKINTWGPSS